MPPLKALTVKQPWPYAIFHLGKPIENRDWETKVRGRVAIHTSKLTRMNEYNMAVAAIRHIMNDSSLEVPHPDDLPAGKIIGTVDVVDCVYQSDSPWFFGDYGFVLRDPVLLPEPIACRGALGFWEVPAAIAIHIERQLQGVVSTV